VAQVRGEEEDANAPRDASAGWSSVCSMLIASKGLCGQASIQRRAADRWCSSPNCALAMDVRYPAPQVESYVSLSVWSSCSR